MTEPLWIFAYGSLLWNPGFDPVETLPARLTGWRRSFCMRSIHFRGTPQAPGLVLALDADDGGDCTGMVLRVDPTQVEPVLAELRARELVSSSYLERVMPLVCDDGRVVRALTYVIDRTGPQYCALDIEEQARIIAAAHGERGTNRDYLFATAHYLRTLGLPDDMLDALSHRVRVLSAER